MPNTKLHRNKAPKSERKSANAGEPQHSLAGFQPVMWPTVFPAKLVYSDYRTMTCTASQVEYVYRLNSVFDPDQSGVGGQPDGFDQLKTLYGRYRVVAADVEVECTGQSANGIIAIAPSDTVGPFLSAEEVAGMRYAVSSVFSATESARIRARYHIGKLLGYSDDSLLANSNLDAAVTANPSFQQYLVVGVEGGTSSTQAQNVWVKITYYVRMEVPIAVLDTSKAKRLRHELALNQAAAKPVAQVAPETQQQPTKESFVVGPANCGAPAPAGVMRDKPVTLSSTNLGNTFGCVDKATTTTGNSPVQCLCPRCAIDK